MTCDGSSVAQLMSGFDGILQKSDATVKDVIIVLSSFLKSIIHSEKIDSDSRENIITGLLNYLKNNELRELND